MVYQRRRPPFTESFNVNLKKVLIAVAAAVVLIGGWKLFTRVDRTNPVAVATAFTNALNKNDTSKASGYVVPTEAEKWQQTADDYISSMKSGAKERYFERVPDAPAFTAPVTVAGKTSISDAGFTLEMTQIDGKWYVSKAPM
jgi:hypothetical protein